MEATIATNVDTPTCCKEEYAPLAETAGVSPSSEEHSPQISA